MRVPEEPVYIDLFRKNPVFTSLHLKYHVHVVLPQDSGMECDCTSPCTRNCGENVQSEFGKKTVLVKERVNKSFIMLILGKTKKVSMWCTPMTIILLVGRLTECDSLLKGVRLYATWR
jgi:hypothetical protein